MLKNPDSSEQTVFQFGKWWHNALPIWLSTFVLHSLCFNFSNVDIHSSLLLHNAKSAKKPDGSEKSVLQFDKCWHTLFQYGHLYTILQFGKCWHTLFQCDRELYIAMNTVVYQPTITLLIMSAQSIKSVNHQSAKGTW